MTPASSRPQPQRWIQWLLKISLPRGVEGQTLRGDLLEEFGDRAATGHVRDAHRWFRRQGTSLAMHYGARRLRLLAPPFGHDVRLAGRSLASQPALTAAVVLMVGLSLGANTALFSVFDGLLLRPLPYRDADRIVHMEVTAATRSALTGPQRDMVRQQERSSPLLTERTDAGPTLLFDVAGPAVQDWQLRPFDLSHTAFELLGVLPILGRPFVPEDATEPQFSVLLGYDVWQTRFGGDPAIIDQLVTIPGRA